MKPPIPVSIVRAKSIDDLREIAALYPSKPPHEQDEMVRRNLVPEFRQQDQGKRVILLACRDERVVGTVQVIWETPDVHVLRQPGSATIHHLRTHPLLQGQGIATQLLAEAKLLAIDRGVMNLTLGVEPQNDRARRVYAAWGFEEYATYTGEHDELIIAMRLSLDRQGTA